MGNLYDPLFFIGVTLLGGGLCNAFVWGVAVFCGGRGKVYSVGRDALVQLAFGMLLIRYGHGLADLVPEVMDTGSLAPLVWALAVCAVPWAARGVLRMLVMSQALEQSTQLLPWRSVSDGKKSN